MTQSWIDSAIIYQVNFRSIAAREPRNAIEAASERKSADSAIAYLTKNLNVIKRLGVNVLHIMPPYPMGIESRKGIGSPYAARNYKAVDPEYGSFEEFRVLVHKAHEKGFKVIVGMVPNHTSRDHVWTQSNPGYYVRDDAGVPLYDLDWSDTAKLNYTDPGLRKAMIDVYDFWLCVLGRDAGGCAGGVDGFRIDMAHFINDLTFWDEALAELRARHPGREILFLAECYGTDNSVGLFRRGFNAAYDDALYKVWENFYGVDGNGCSCVLPAPDLERHDYFAGLYQAFRTDGVAGAVEQLMRDYETRLGEFDPSPRWARYTDNHDEGRGSYRFGPEAVRAMTLLIHTMPRGIPFMLTGQEFGAANRPSIHERIGPCDKGCRVRIPGGSERREGVEFEGNLFARGFDERRHTYAFYQDVIKLRKRSKVFADGSLKLIDAGEDAERPDRTVVAFERALGRTSVRVAVNMGGETRNINPELFQGQLLFGNWNGKALRPFSGMVVRTE